MFRKGAILRSQTAKIDDAFPLVILRRLTEIHRTLFLHAGKVATRDHRVDQIVGGIDPVWKNPQTRDIEEICIHDVQAGLGIAEIAHGKASSVTDDCCDFMPSIQRGLQQPQAYVSICTCDDNMHASNLCLSEFCTMENT
jgi:hypothetical protein